MTLNSINLNAKGVIGIAIVALMAGLITWMSLPSAHKNSHQAKAEVLIEPM